MQMSAVDNDGKRGAAVARTTNAPRWRAAALAVAALIPGSVLAQATPRVEEDIVVLGRWDNPFGYSSTASQGVVGAAEIDARPRLRTGEILEVVPGLIVT